MTLRIAFMCAICTAWAFPCLGQNTTRLSENELLGTWKLVKAERDGKPSKAYITKLVFKKGGKIEIYETSRKGQFASIGKFKVRMRGKVKELDEGHTTKDGKPIQSRDKSGELSYLSANRGIYKIEKGTLTICWQFLGDRPRPKAFKTKKGDRAELLVLKRVVPKTK